MRIVKVSRIFLAVTCFCGYMTNKLKKRELFLDRMDRTFLHLILGRRGESKIPTFLQIKHFNRAVWNSKIVLLNKAHKAI